MPCHNNIELNEEGEIIRIYVLGGEEIIIVKCRGSVLFLA
jgi:hypothetical protein